MVLGGGSVGMCSGHEGGALRSGISALIKEAPESTLVPPPCEDTVKRQLTMNQEKGLYYTVNLPAP